MKLADTFAPWLRSLPESRPFFDDAREYETATSYDSEYFDWETGEHVERQS